MHWENGEPPLPSSLSSPPPSLSCSLPPLFPPSLAPSLLSPSSLLFFVSSQTTLFSGPRNKLYEIASESWGMGDDDMRQSMSVIASAAAWGMGRWDSMEDYVRSIPHVSFEGFFYQALLHIHHRQFSASQQVRKCTTMQLCTALVYTSDLTGSMKVWICSSIS